jgi:hypothetical protein
LAEHDEAPVVPLQRFLTRAPWQASAVHPAWQN